MVADLAGAGTAGAIAAHADLTEIAGPPDRAVPHRDRRSAADRVLQASEPPACVIGPPAFRRLRYSPKQLKFHGPRPCRRGGRMRLTIDSTAELA